jgi:hypothetical protein
LRISTDTYCKAQGKIYHEPNFGENHYKESYAFQPMYLQLLSKSIIFVVLNMTIFCGT